MALFFVDGHVTGVAQAPVQLYAAETGPCDMIVQADPGNTSIVRLGSATSQSMAMSPGDREIIEADHASVFYVTADTGSNSRVNFHIRGS